LFVENQFTWLLNNVQTSRGTGGNAVLVHLGMNVKVLSATLLNSTYNPFALIPLIPREVKNLDMTKTRDRKERITCHVLVAFV